MDITGNSIRNFNIFSRQIYNLIFNEFCFKQKNHFFLLILSGAILRFYNINFDNLWYDEIISFWVANPKYSFEESLIFHKKIEIAPYAFNLILKYYYTILVMKLTMPDICSFF